MSEGGRLQPLTVMKEGNEVRSVPRPDLSLSLVSGDSSERKELTPRTASSLCQADQSPVTGAPAPLPPSVKLPWKLAGSRE